MHWSVRMLLPAVVAAGSAIGQTQEQADFFESKIRPLLIDNCHQCHTDAQSGGLRLDSREALLKGGNHGPALKPGERDSLLLQVVSHTHLNLQMPPSGKLDQQEIDDLIQWVADGAVWPQSPLDLFTAKIRPLLEEKCLGCHAEEPQGGLKIDSRESLLTGGKSGPAIIPGDPAASPMIQAVRGEGETSQMPPGAPLSGDAVELLARWVAQGAVWERKEALPEYEISEDQRRFWSFQPISRPAPPEIAREGWSDNPIDRFILSKLGQDGLEPGRPADKRTLRRRLSYDLIGLPPTAAEIDSFLADDSPQAYSKFVERLLASPRYGERWGRHWLDVVRYADTAGDAGDFPVPEAYKYRNYVIDAFNDDKPYDEFVREQLAGDLLPYADEQQRWEHIVATGYVAISRRIGVSPQNMRHVTIEDTIDNVSKTFLGLSVGCARCHNHKFDPIPASDYYALYGILDSSVYPHAGAEHKPHREDFVYRVGAEKAAELLASHNHDLEKLREREREKFGEYQSFQQKKITTPGRSREIVWAELEQIRAEIGEFAKTFPALEIAYALQDGDPHNARLQKAGDPTALGPEVPRGFLQILGGEILPKAHRSSGRLELANWVADAQNPLTARVIVNRIWRHHFGQGLVSTTSDFGVRGAPPTHPELLDYLAGRFIDDGWSIKNLHRLIVSSQTYRLSSASIAANAAVDPENRLLWRANRRRLDAEQIRDSLLSFGGRLDLSRGERHPFPHYLTYFYRQHEPFQEKYPTNLRSVYMMQQRIQKDPYLDLFDGPDGNLPLAERRATTTTLQALFMMNSKFIHDQADAIADRLSESASEAPIRIRQAYETIFNRAPSDQEIADGGRLIATAKAEFDAAGASDPARSAWSGYIRAMISSNEFLFIE